MTQHLSSSAFQQELEKRIIEALKALKGLDRISQGVLREVKSNDVTVQFNFDFEALEILKAPVIGEIFTTLLPFKAGQKRKFKGDILKLLTYEKLVKKKCHKYVVVTVHEDWIRKKNVILSEQSVFLYHSDAISQLLGKRSWLLEAIKVFEINLLFYVLSNEEGNEINVVREMQKIGMRGSD